MTDKLINLLSVLDAGFQTKQNYSFGYEFADLYAFRKGRNFVFPQRDYFFFHDIEKRKITAELAEKLHNGARAFVNSDYKLPKAMRLTVPNITSVFYSDKSVDNELVQLGSKWTRSMIGGEIHQIIFVDLRSKTIYSQGTHTVKAAVQGVIVNIKFNKIDPQNRSIYLIEKLIQSL